MENTENKETKINTPIIEMLRQENLKSNVPEGEKIEIGDTVQANVKIIEGDKERVQAFQGVVIAKSGVGVAETITLRRVSHGQGVERIFPVHSPRIDGFKIIRKGSVRRSKLYYLRNAVGNAAKIKEKRDKKKGAANDARQPHNSHRRHGHISGSADGDGVGARTPGEAGRAGRGHGDYDEVGQGRLVRGGHVGCAVRVGMTQGGAAERRDRD